jgi:O-antigen/teichoic acid export membrane protein
MRLAVRTSQREGALLVAAARALPIASALVINPIIVHEIGIRAYGFWAVVGGFASWAALLDFGIGPAIQRMVAAASPADRSRDIGRAFTTGFVLFGAVALLPPVAGLVSVAVLPQQWTSNWPQGWQLTIVFAAVSLSLSMLSSAFLAIPSGLSYWRGVSVVTALSQGVFSCAVLAYLAMGAGVAGVAAALLTASAVTFVLSVVAAIRSQPDLLRNLRFERSTANALLRYGSSIQLSNVAQVFNTQTDKLILPLVADLAFVGYFELGSRAAFSLRTLALSRFAPMIPVSAEVSAVQGRAGLSRFYIAEFRRTLRSLVVPLLAFNPLLFVLMFLWLGSGFAISAWVAVLLLTGYSLNLATGPGTSAARGAGRADIDRNYSIVALVMNVALTVALAPFGPWGVVAATSVALAVSSLLLLRQVDSWLDTRLLPLNMRLFRWPARREVAGVVVTSIALTAVCSVFVHDRVTAAACAASIVLVAAVSTYASWHSRRLHESARSVEVNA